MGEDNAMMVQYVPCKGCGRSGTTEQYVERQVLVSVTVVENLIGWTIARNKTYQTRYFCAACDAREEEAKEQKRGRFGMMLCVVGVVLFGGVSYGLSYGLIGAGTLFLCWVLYAGRKKRALVTVERSE